MPAQAAQPVPRLVVTATGQSQAARSLPVETPVAMVCNGSSQAVMLASPADIEDFAYGFALSEGIVTAADQIIEFEVAEHEAGIEARMWLRDDRAEALGARRRFMAGPVGCGLCGIDSLEQAARTLPRLTGGPNWHWRVLSEAANSLRNWQPLQDETRAVHAAGFVLPGQGIQMAREDVGRHNAMDKLIGAALRDGQDLSAGAIVLTSRVSVELIQKAALAGVTTLVAVSAPTTLAIAQAHEAGLTVAALARPDRLEIFTHSSRITYEVSDVA